MFYPAADDGIRSTPGGGKMAVLDPESFVIDFNGLRIKSLGSNAVIRKTPNLHFGTQEAWQFTIKSWSHNSLIIPLWAPPLRNCGIF